MKAQQQRGSNHAHNEAIIDPRSIEAHLPDSVLAFFYEPGQVGSDCIARHQQNFVHHFALEADERPILQLDLGHEQPFALYQS